MAGGSPTFVPIPAITEESSESENETEPASVFQRRVSTSKELNGSVSDFCFYFVLSFGRAVVELGEQSDFGEAPQSEAIYHSVSSKFTHDPIRTYEIA